MLYNTETCFVICHGLKEHYRKDGRQTFLSSESKPTIRLKIGNWQIGKYSGYKESHKNFSGLFQCKMLDLPVLFGYKRGLSPLYNYYK